MTVAARFNLYRKSKHDYFLSLVHVFKTKRHVVWSVDKIKIQLDSKVKYLPQTKNLNKNIPLLSFSFPFRLAINTWWILFTKTSLLETQVVIHTFKTTNFNIQKEILLFHFRTCYAVDPLVSRGRKGILQLRAYNRRQNCWDIVLK